MLKTKIHLKTENASTDYRSLAYHASVCQWCQLLSNRLENLTTTHIFYSHNQAYFNLEIKLNKMQIISRHGQGLSHSSANDRERWSRKSDCVTLDSLNFVLTGCLTYVRLLPYWCFAKLHAPASLKQTWTTRILQSVFPFRFWSNLENIDWWLDKYWIKAQIRFPIRICIRVRKRPSWADRIIHLLNESWMICKWPHWYW